MPHILTATSVHGNVAEYKLTRYEGDMRRIEHCYSIAFDDKGGYEASLIFKDFGMNYEEALLGIKAYIRMKIHKQGQKEIVHEYC